MAAMRDPDPASSLIVDSDPDSGSQKTNADPDLGSSTNADLSETKSLIFTWRIYLLIIGQKAYLQRYKSLVERHETRFICLLW